MGAKKARRADAGGALHARGLSASSRPACQSLHRRHSLWPFCRHLRGQDPPDLTATVPAAAGDAPQGRSPRTAPRRPKRQGGRSLWLPWCVERLRSSYGAAACLLAGFKCPGSDQRCCINATLMALADRRSAPPHTRSMPARGRAGATRSLDPRRTAATPGPRGALHPRAIPAPGDQVQSTRRSLRTLIGGENGFSSLSIRLAWACAARSAHV